MTGNCSLQFSLHFRSNNLINGTSENYKNDKTRLLTEKIVGQYDQIFYFRRCFEQLKNLNVRHISVDLLQMHCHDNVTCVLVIFPEEWEQRHFKWVRMQTDFCPIIHNYCAKLRHWLSTVLHRSTKISFHLHAIVEKVSFVFVAPGIVLGFGEERRKRAGEKCS